MTLIKGVDNYRLFKNFLLELFFPSFCLGCKKEGTYLCHDCKSTLEISEYNYCLCSSNPLRLPARDTQAGLAPLAQGKCSRCKDKKLSGLYFALPYKEKFLTKKIIYQFKYEPYIKDLAKNLAGILVEHFVLTKNNTNQTWENSLLVPVPLAKKRLKIRGYNQAEELAKELSKVIKIPVASDNLIKIKPTLPQIKLSGKQRQENVKGSFAIKTPADIKGRKIFLVDDVYTTGSTMEECARILRNAGAKQIWGIAIAREE